MEKLEPAPPSPAPPSSEGQDPVAAEAPKAAADQAGNEANEMASPPVAPAKSTDPVIPEVVAAADEPEVAEAAPEADPPGPQGPSDTSDTSDQALPSTRPEQNMPQSTPAPPLSDLASLAGLAQSLPSLPAPAAALAPPSKPKATITALSEKSLPEIPASDSRVVATALIPSPPDPIAADSLEEPEEGAPFSADDTTSESDAEPSAEAPEAPRPLSPNPQPLSAPLAHDELAPRRADRSSKAFEVPAAAGDLLIASNSQTDFQMEDKRVVFTGSVVMKNERFYLTADRLVAYMKADQSGLEFAEAQGNVIVRMVENGQETGSSGLSKTAVFHPQTGEIVLKGWPQLRMGNKAHVASSATTEMSLFTDGRMKTSGRNQTMIVP